MLNVSKSTASSNSGSIFTLEKLIFSFGVKNPLLSLAAGASSASALDAFLYKQGKHDVERLLPMPLVVGVVAVRHRLQDLVCCVFRRVNNLIASEYMMEAIANELVLLYSLSPSS